jgi:hypothetical protein
MKSTYLNFSQQLTPSQYFLMEVDPQIIQQLQADQTITIKEPQPQVYHATAHTANASYSLALNEISNSLLLCPLNTDGRNQIECCTSSYLCAIAMAPNYHRIEAILYNYRIDINTFASSPIGITFAYLLKEAQISKHELENYTNRNLSIVQWNSMLYKINVTSALKTLENILMFYKTSMKQSIAQPLINVPLLAGLPKQVISAILNEIADESSTIWELNPIKIGVCCANLLFNVKSKFQLKEFMVAHQALFESLCSYPYSSIQGFELIPEIRLGFLKSRAYIWWDPNYKLDLVIERIDAASFSFNVLERINKLSELKEQWHINELEPLLEPLINDPTVNTEKLISKYYKCISIENPANRKISMQVLIKKSYI